MASSPMDRRGREEQEQMGLGLGFVGLPWPDKGESSFPRESSRDVGFAPTFGVRLCLV